MFDDVYVEDVITHFVEQKMIHFFSMLHCLEIENGIFYFPKEAVLQQKRKNSQVYSIFYSTLYSTLPRKLFYL